MAINREMLQFVSIEELLGIHAPDLRIPDFQRPYSWTPRIAAQLFTDVGEALDGRPEHSYILGTVILLKRPHESHFEVVDGQQRILTLHLLRALLRGQRIPQLQSGDTPIHHVHQELSRRVSDLERSPGRLDKYRDFLDSKARVLKIVTDDEDEAFQFFDSQNFRGKSLRPHDLLKAFHLREMADASTSEQRAVVEQWEKADENALDRLFGTYLARIHWWSRNMPAHAFTADDLDLFKGVGRSTRRLPGAEYHRAAKTVLPGLQEWSYPDADAVTRRDLKRAQHQLDAPVAAGKSFFHYATFMLEEYERLDEMLFSDVNTAGLTSAELTVFHDGARFRYCRELYVAVALYYTNKYSEDDMPQVRRHLFRWAYALRLVYERLGWRSADNYARGISNNMESLNEVNLFSAIRDSLDPREIELENLIAPNTARSGNSDDARLLTLLKESR
ncbi:hypothetical protein CQ010_16560 [Arthrobacter sp. MYb211]|uniref:DUF262 domain-containing protein n=1 Tax=unclassified Arthrobacter TaxID=235627 RepID=UPI000CFD30E9|nr:MULTISPECIES: DUF262 domain-containing protein [unclassified Arthrobacter]PRA09862.1 hypothetical protein CQ015_16550 [Arthrobacter sp. MYb221]PRC04869.1 hypothetical protein CQ010_16560 [Arthrobacter sp. MYb211]